MCRGEKREVGVGNRNAWISGRFGELDHLRVCKFLKKHIWMVYLK